jgi:hypothetical protein
MRRVPWRPACRCAAGALLLALLGLVPALLTVTAPAFASTVRLHYEDAFDDVQATAETEAEVKAAFLLRFPDFVNWRTTPGDTLRIGVVGDDALLQMLSRLAAQENQPGLGGAYAIAITRIASASAAKRCHILVLGETVVPDLLPGLMAAYKAGVLTVGVWNTPRSGTIIRLFREGSRVRFDISQTLAKEAGLSISSKLLNLAREQSSRVFPNAVDPARG